MPREVNKVFIGYPLDLGGGSSSPLGPLGPPRALKYFGLPMVNPRRPPLPPNKPYHWQLNYHEYVKDFDKDAYARVFKATFKANGEIEDAKIVNMFTFTLKDIVFN
jgi:hypothetical protein